MGLLINIHHITSFGREDTRDFGMAKGSGMSRLRRSISNGKNLEET
jgi:hypothetical protein